MNRTSVELIKERLPIEDVIGGYVKLEKAGKSWKAKCPFHNEKTASFFVSPDRGGYYCFGCGEKGDIFSFVEKFEGLDFKGALKVLAERAGVALVFDQKADSEKDRLFDIAEQAALFFEGEYSKSKEAQDYLNSRGINEATRKDFRIGWVPEGWKNLYSYLRKKGYNDSIIEKAGLAKKGDKGDFYDRFRGRVMFPITDSSGRVVAFSGRILKDDRKSAKYLNSPDTPLFNKSQILFGLDKAKNEIRRVNYSILVEGQMDLVLSHQVGVKNTIAASGTALTDQTTGTDGVVSNLAMVRRLSPNMIIALDSDKAGRTAAMRAVAATALSMGMSVKIADIEGGKDPADLIMTEPESWKNVLRNAKHVVEFELGNVLRDVKDPHKVSRALRDRVFPFLSKIDSEMDKAFYVKHISEKTGLAEQAVWEDLRKKEKEEENEKGKNSISSTTTIPSSVSISSPSVLPAHRLGLVERRMFGLLTLMESAGLPQAKDYRHEVKKIAGSSYETRVKDIELVQSDVSFEAEAFFGGEQGRWDTHMKELLINFEEDLVNEDLMAAMSALRTAERAGESEKVAELAKRCQVLSMRKAEVNQKRRH
jgi:DNA primase